MFQVIPDSYEWRSVVLKTNLEFSRWVRIFYDEQITAAIIDRLVHYSYLLLYDALAIACAARWITKHTF